MKAKILASWTCGLFCGLVAGQCLMRTAELQGWDWIAEPAVLLALPCIAITGVVVGRKWRQMRDYDQGYKDGARETYDSLVPRHYPGEEDDE